jgi:alkylation response protein AidB-like acyl-CoA dehydrogenase
MPSSTATLLGHHPALVPAARLDRELGDPYNDATICSYSRCQELARSATFPAEICALLDQSGLARYYVPVRYGGSLANYEQTLHLLRMLARRDLGVAVAHGQTYLGGVAVWVAGSADQSSWLAEQIMAAVPASLALTERAHGSDLLAGEVSAAATPDGYLLSGEKWLINNATRGQIVCVLARTGAAGGPRGFSLLLVDKRRVDPSRYRNLPKVDTHGVRVADISGIVFDDMPVPLDALIGPEGAGLEILLRALQLTRTSAGALSLGAADQAVAIAERMTGDDGRPAGRSTIAALGQVYAMLFLAEALSLVACRSIHAMPGEMSVVSAVTKYLVPTVVDELIGRLAQLMGRWSCLDHPSLTDRFSQVERDHRIVGIFDGNTFVNQTSLINQFPVLHRTHRRRSGDLAGLELATTLSVPLPEADLDRLSLLARDGCTLLHSLPAAANEMAGLASTGEIGTELADTVHDLAAIVDELHAAIALPARREVAPWYFDCARRYALCVGAAACVQLWVRNRDCPVVAPVLWSHGTWLHASLTYVLDQLGGRREGSPAFRQLFDAVSGPAALIGRGQPASLLAHPAGELGP